MSSQSGTDQKKVSLKGKRNETFQAQKGAPDKENIVSTGKPVDDKDGFGVIKHLKGKRFELKQQIKDSKDPHKRAQNPQQAKEELKKTNRALHVKKKQMKTAESLKSQSRPQAELNELYAQKSQVKHDKARREKGGLPTEKETAKIKGLDEKIDQVEMSNKPNAALSQDKMRRTIAEGMARGIQAEEFAQRRAQKSAEKLQPQENQVKKNVEDIDFQNPADLDTLLTDPETGKKPESVSNMVENTPTRKVIEEPAQKINSGLDTSATGSETTENNQDQKPIEGEVLENETIEVTELPTGFERGEEFKAEAKAPLETAEKPQAEKTTAIHTSFSEVVNNPKTTIAMLKSLDQAISAQNYQPNEAGNGVTIELFNGNFVVDVDHSELKENAFQEAHAALNAPEVNEDEKTINEAEVPTVDQMVEEPEVELNANEKVIENEPPVLDVETHGVDGADIDSLLAKDEAEDPVINEQSAAIDDAFNDEIHIPEEEMDAFNKEAGESEVEIPTLDPVQDAPKKQNTAVQNQIDNYPISAQRSDHLLPPIPPSQARQFMDNIKQYLKGQVAASRIGQKISTFKGKNVVPTQKFTDTKLADLEESMDASEYAELEENLSENIDEATKLANGDKRIDDTVISAKKAQEMEASSFNSPAPSAKQDQESDAELNAEQRAATSIRANGEDMSSGIEKALKSETSKEATSHAHNISSEELAELNSIQYDSEVEAVNDTSPNQTDELETAHNTAEKSSETQTQEETEVAAKEVAQEAAPRNLSQINAEIDALINEAYADPEHIKAVLQAGQDKDSAKFQELTSPPVYNEEARLKVARAFADEKLQNASPEERAEKLKNLRVKESELTSPEAYFEQGDYIEQLVTDPRSFSKDGSGKMFTAEGRKAMQLGGEHAPNAKLAELLHEQRKAMAVEVEVVHDHQQFIDDRQTMTLDEMEDYHRKHNEEVSVDVNNLGTPNLDHTQENDHGRGGMAMA